MNVEPGWWNGRLPSRVVFIDRVESIEDLYRVCEDENGELVRVPVSVMEK